MSPRDLRVLVKCEALVEALLDRTAGFPKVVRFTLTQRVENAALDALEALVEARFAPGAEADAPLARVDAALARLRVLLRLCHRRRVLSGGGYEALSQDVDEVGRMVGGWRRR